MKPTDGVMSDTFSLLFRVPQGSALGPALFTWYTKPLAQQYEVKYYLYAEDTAVGISGSWE